MRRILDATGRLNLGHVCRDKQKILLHKAARFNALTEKLSFEGRSQVKKNAGATLKLTRFFSEKIKKYIQVEERIVFPALDRYLPQDGCLLIHFRAEHKTLLSELSRLRKLSELLMTTSKNNKIAESVIRIRQCGMYVSHLLKHHLISEGEYLGLALNKAIETEPRNEAGLCTGRFRK